MKHLFQHITANIIQNNVFLNASVGNIGLQDQVSTSQYANNVLPHLPLNTNPASFLWYSLSLWSSHSYPLVQHSGSQSVFQGFLQVTKILLGGPRGQTCYFLNIRMLLSFHSHSPMDLQSFPEAMWCVLFATDSVQVAAMIIQLSLTK